MKTFTLRHSKEALVAAVAALSLVSAVATVSLVPQMAQACVNHSIASSVSAVGNAQLTAVFMAHVSGSPKPVMVASLR